MTRFLFEIIVTIVVTLIASSGFWAFILKRMENKDNRTILLLGLAHDRIIYIGKSYLRRGSITYDEYEDFMKYLYLPYSEFGGNGLAEKIKNEVAKLPMTANIQYTRKDETPHDRTGDSREGF